MIHITALADRTGTTLLRVHVNADPDVFALLPKGVRRNRTQSVDICFDADGVNGGVNETGMKRVRALLKAVDKLEIGLVFTQRAAVMNELNIKLWGMTMHQLTRAELEALIN